MKASRPDFTGGRGEAIGPRTIIGTLLVLVSVVVISTTQAKQAQPSFDETDRLAQPSVEI